MSCARSSSFPTAARAGVAPPSAPAQPSSEWQRLIHRQSVSPKGEKQKRQAELREYVRKALADDDILEMKGP